MSNLSDNTELTEDEQKEQIRLYENDILGGLLAASSFIKDDEETYPVEISRNGTVVLKFSIRPLTDDEYNQAKEHNTKYARNKQLGIRYAESTDTIRYRSELIYVATVDADREKIWNNKKAWEALNVINGPDLIGRVLKAGEKAAVLNLLDRISGYDINLEDTAKN